MKKILIIGAAALLAAGAFAVDFSATVHQNMYILQSGYSWEEGKDNFRFKMFGIENTTQQDNDLLSVNFSGDKGGATFKFWTTPKQGLTSDNITTSGDSDGMIPLAVRGLKVWFNPVDWMTVSVGNVGLYMFTESINWWKVPVGASLVQFEGWDARWSSTYLDEQGGVTVELNNPFGVNGLYVGLGVAPNFDNFFYVHDSTATDPDTWLPWGAVATYAIGDTGVKLGVAYRDTGKGGWKRLAIGGTASLGSFYGMLQAQVRFDNSAQGWTAASDNDPNELAGITIDNDFSYTLGNGINFHLVAPVTIRGFLGEDDDPSYMTWAFRTTIPVSPVSLYFDIRSDSDLVAYSGIDNGGDSTNAWRFDDKFKLSMGAMVGVAFNIGVASIDTGLAFGIDSYKGYNNYANNLQFQVPVKVVIAF